MDEYGEMSWDIGDYNDLIVIDDYPLSPDCENTPVSAEDYDEQCWHEAFWHGEEYDG